MKSIKELIVVFALSKKEGVLLRYHRFNIYKNYYFKKNVILVNF